MSWSDARRAFVRAALAATALALAGCGFHLRGDVSYPFSTIYVNSTASVPMGVELKRVLQSATDLKLAAKPAEAQVILDITSVVDDKSVLSLSSGGKVQEYLLVKRVSFSLHDAAGGDWLPPNEITIRRSFTFSESEVLARQAQEAQLLREMQTDAVQQVLRRLQAAKKPTA